MVELKGLPFPVYLTKQVFKNGDGKEASLYLITNDEFLNYNSTINVYKNGGILKFIINHWNKTVQWVKQQ